ncbi:hypothetical protein [Nisaea sp.]|uniref:hypothetical protein n=1 Tax=Nisaea sp. TaxID=2024842 RepID=UPI002B26E37E|nr:hypothetical protein [Nisaea sp.]
MRAFSMALAFAVLLSGCQTTKPLGPLALQDGYGSGLLQLCFGLNSAERNFTLTAQEIDPASRTLAFGPASHRLEKTLRLHETRDVNGGAFLAKNRRHCTFWQFEAPAGEYAIVKVGERLSTAGSAGSAGGSLLGAALGAAIAVAIIATAKNDEVVFVRADGSLKNDTPTFEIQPGETTHLGTIMYDGEQEPREQPRLDPNGYWDGQSTDTVKVTRLILAYFPAGSVPDTTKAIAGKYEANLPRQTISHLTGRTVIIEDFPEVAPLPQ